MDTEEVTDVDMEEVTGVLTEGLTADTEGDSYEC